MKLMSESQQFLYIFPKILQFLLSIFELTAKMHNFMLQNYYNKFLEMSTKLSGARFVLSESESESESERRSNIPCEH